MGQAKISTMSVMTKVGITGGLGCGKSTVAGLLERHGCRRLDSDRIVREQVLTSPRVISAIRERFGNEVFRSEDVVDRPALAQKVFAVAGDRLWLESLIHPEVYSVWRAEFDQAPGSCWVVEVPLLFEKALENWFDFTVCVALSPHQQFVRLERRGLSRELAEQRMSTQLSLVKKMELADLVVWNDGSPEFLETQVASLATVIWRA